MGITKKSIFIGLFLIFLAGLVLADNDIYNNENLHKYNIYNATNITATSFFGDGSHLSNVNVSTVETDPIFISQNSTIWSAILLRLTSAQVNSTIDARVNAAFITALGFYSGNHTQIANAYTDSKLLNYYNKTQEEANLTLIYSQISSVNTTTNIQALGFYTKAQVDTNLSNYLLLTDQRYNDTALILSVNSTSNIQNLGFYNITQINAFNASWVATYNLTYNTLLAQTCQSGYAINQIQSNGTVLCGQAGQPWNITGSIYLVNASNILTVNETKLNITIDNRASAFNETTRINSVNTTANIQALFTTQNLTVSTLFATFLGSFSSPITTSYITNLQAVNGNFTQNLTIGTKICFNGDLCSVAEYWNGTALITG